MKRHVASWAVVVSVGSSEVDHGLFDRKVGAGLHFVREESLSKGIRICSKLSRVLRAISLFFRRGESCAEAFNSLMYCMEF